MFPLHVPTLLLATALVVAVAGFLLTVSSDRNVASRAFALWGSAMLVGASGLSALAAAPLLDGAGIGVGPGGGLGGAVQLAGTAAILLGTALSWSAARRFRGRPVMPGLVLLGPAAYLGSAIGRDAGSTISTSVALLTGSVYTLAAARQLWRTRTVKLRSRDAALVLLAVHGMIHLARGASLVLLPDHPALHSPAISAALLLETLLHTVAMALLLLAMMKEVSLGQSLAEARHLALLDGLTGLGNRRYFDDALDYESSLAQRESRPLALLMIDADYFKQINDVFGHQRGDQCLRAIAQAIRSGLRRPRDTVSRFGGEEFAVLLPDTDENGARAVAATIHAAVERLNLEHPGTPTRRATVSIGIGLQVPGRGSARPITLVRASDRALYAAKARGRNRTEFTGEPGPPIPAGRTVP